MAPDQGAALQLPQADAEVRLYPCDGAVLISPQWSVNFGICGLSVIGWAAGISVEI